MNNDGNEVVFSSFRYDARTWTICGQSDEYIFDLIHSRKTFYELDLLETLRGLIAGRPGIVLDVGANIGNHSVYFAGPMGREVIAVEAEPGNYDNLQRTVAANSLNDSITALNIVAWSSASQMSVEQKIAGNRGSFTVVEDPEGHLEGIRLDEIVDPDTPVAAIKLDIEGSEFDALLGLKSTIVNNKPVISVESHGSGASEQLATLLEELGYFCIDIKGRSDNNLWISKSSELPEELAKAITVSARNSRYQNKLLSETRSSIQRIEEATKLLANQSPEILERVSSIGKNLSDSPKLAERDSLSEQLAMLVAALSAQTLESRNNINSELTSKLDHFMQILHGESELLKEKLAELRSLEESILSRENQTSPVSDRLDQQSKAVSDQNGRYLAETEMLLREIKSTLRGFDEFPFFSKSELLAVGGKIEALQAGFEQLQNSVAGVTRGLEDKTDPLETKRRELNVESLAAETDRVLARLDQLAAENARTISGLRAVNMDEERKLNDVIAKLAEIEVGIKTAVDQVEKTPDSSTPAHDGDLSSDYEDVLKLAKAYVRLSSRFESVSPADWCAETAVTTLGSGLRSEAAKLALSDAAKENLGGTGSIVPITSETGHQRSSTGANRELKIPIHGHDRRYEPVRVGIASMPGREYGLAEVVKIIAPQADEVFVYLNGMDEVPVTLPTYPNVWYVTGPDLGDRGKFAFIENFHGYYLTCDDDIAYARFHVHSIIDGIERYGRSAIVGWHGSIFKPEFERFYDAKSRQVLSFRFLRGKDTPVHLLGTGVCGFHTDTIDIHLEDFIYPNMADAFLAVAAKQQDVPMVVLRHERDWATPIEVGPSISSVSLGKDKDDTGAGFDVAATVTNLVNQNGPWGKLAVDTSSMKPNTRQTFTVGLIGRTDRDRWKKGGILKSSHLTVSALNRFGVRTLLEDIETGDPVNFHGEDPDVVLIYVGDPERPDFKEVEKLLERHATAQRSVVINLSINGKPTRNKTIVEKMLGWEKRFGRLVRLMVFTEAAFSISELEPVRHLMVIVPKTISLPDAPLANFGKSKGIFLGDIAKMNDDSLLGIPAKEWLKAIRMSVPDVPLYAVKQYKPRVDQNLDVDEVWPFLKGSEFSNRISQCRLMVSLVKFATFEMVPLEVASLGLPVVYPEMPQSLSEYLGLAGYAVRTPSELQYILPELYYDPVVWRSMSRAAIERAWSSELERLSGQMYLRLLSLVKEREQ